MGHVSVCIFYSSAYQFHACKPLYNSKYLERQLANILVTAVNSVIDMVCTVCTYTRAYTNQHGGV